MQSKKNAKSIPNKHKLDTVSQNKLQKYKLVRVDYDHPKDYCLYTIRIIQTKELIDLTISYVFNDDDLLNGFGVDDLRRICLDYSNMIEINMQKSLGKIRI